MCKIYNSSVCLNSFHKFSNYPEKELSSEMESKFSVSVAPYTAEFQEPRTTALRSAINISFSTNNSGFGSKPRVLLLHSYDCSEHNDFVIAFMNYLENQCNLQVTTIYGNSGNSKEWVKNRYKECDVIIFVISAVQDAVDNESHVHIINVLNDIAKNDLSSSCNKEICLDECSNNSDSSESIENSDAFIMEFLSAKVSKSSETSENLLVPPSFNDSNQVIEKGDYIQVNILESSESSDDEETNFFEHHVKTIH
ncbi:hypothetical protein CEXT_648171 [Caerostris extrusa]|uniref:SEFIR domain-containing protein n=1 Tax=Caerostris extrusa TaxID=172846 RepID=A0AAV4NTQ3_CAEEX|nr:hypothetical protein CEXT_648171 [Caerostris extrusa]